MTNRVQPKQVSRIPDLPAPQISGPDVMIPIHGDGDLTRVEQGSGKSREIPVDGVKFPTLDGNDIRAAGKKKDKPKDPELVEDTGEGDLEEAKSKNDSLELSLEEDDQVTPDGEPVDPNKFKSPKPGRDYTKFIDPDMAEIASGLPNVLYAKFEQLAPKWKAALDENKTLREAAAKIPSFHYEHPEGYVLSPEWPKLTAAFNAYDHETKHWENQLYAIEQGELWRDFRGYDEKGQPVYAVVQPLENGKVDVKARIHAQKNLQVAQNQYQQVQAAAQNHITTYGQKVQNAKNEIDALCKKAFPSLDPVKFEGPDKEAYETVAQMVPEQFKNHPMTKIGQLTYVYALKIARQGMKWKKELDIANAKLAGKARAQNSRVPAASTAADESGDVMIPIED